MQGVVDNTMVRWLTALVVLCLTPALVSAQQSPTDKIKELKAAAQKELPPDKADKFIGYLMDANPKVQLEALKYWQKLYARPPKQALEINVKSMLQATEHCMTWGDKAVRQETLRLLAGFGWEATSLAGMMCPSGLEESLTMKSEESLKLWSIRYPKEVAALLSDSNPTVVFSAIRTMERGELLQHKPQIRGLLKSKDPKMQMIGVHYLQAKDTHEFALIMGRFLESSDSLVAYVADLRLIKTSVNPEELFKNRSKYTVALRVRMPGMIAQSCLDRVTQTKMLTDLAKDKDKRVRDEALKYLARSG